MSEPCWLNEDCIAGHHMDDIQCRFPNPNACTECEAGRCETCISWLLCLCDAEDHERRRPVAEDDVRAMIYVEVPLGASADETDCLVDAVSEAAYGFVRGDWDPLVYASIKHPVEDAP